LDKAMAQKAMTVEQEAAPGPKADGRRQRGTASAQRIIDATIRLIADEGLGGMTMQRIAQSIGSSNSLVVFHFGSKENLLRAVIQHLSDQFDQMWQQMVNAPGLTAEQRVLGAIDCARHFSRQHPDWVAVWVMVGGDRQTMQIDRAISAPNDLAYTAQVRALLAEIAESGDYAGADPDILSAGLNYLVQGAWYWDNAFPDAKASDAMHKTALMLLAYAFPRHFAPG
jgi:AcrR family transcriptional regulator